MPIDPIGNGNHPLIENNQDRSAVLVPVTLSSKSAGPEEEAEAILRSLGYTTADLASPVGLKLKEDLTETLEGMRHNYNAGHRVYDAESKSYKWQTQVPLEAGLHKRLKDFVAEQRALERQAALGPGSETRAGQEAQAYGAVWKQRILEGRVSESVTVLGTAEALPLETPAVSLPTAAEIGRAAARTGAVIGEASLPAAGVAAEGAALYLGTGFLLRKGLEAKHAIEMARADAAYRRLEAQRQVSLQQTTATTLAPPLSLPMSDEDAIPLPEGKGQPKVTQKPTDAQPDIWTPGEAGPLVPTSGGPATTTAPAETSTSIPTAQPTMPPPPPAGGPEQKPPVEPKEIITATIATATTAATGIGLTEALRSDETQKTEQVKYPPSTPTSEAAAIRVRDAMDRAGIGKTVARSVGVLTHKDETVTIAVSGNAREVQKVYNRLKQTLDAEFGPSNYRFGPAEMDTTGFAPITLDDRELIKDTCAEPRLFQGARTHDSPVTGMTVIWRGKGENPYPLEPGSDFMDPCQSCQINEQTIIGNIKMETERRQ